ncbi:hypothetical protein [Nonomuraea gerenzanensis]|uniref:Integral membrane protein n=1 Tax=Nonomuraea gerenzanensis TaxID=93944 RepID=A0A1M4DVZ3_9ACTN|nr:hypothetical protein [Nonomuraea gerenzanensis]UBU13094.1 hypothetical protein LCN96_54135 [Nonomuraea gerenzanensis]SBO90737.1 hypothetical protein BN4615_P251 [Nonomuraea gerenzanensis]
MPGRWVEGAGAVLGPLLLAAGVLVRTGVDDFFPAQLAAHAVAPVRMAWSYGLYAAGVVLLWPAVTALGRRIGPSGWARWGVTLVVIGLFGRVFHAGVSHLAFQLVDVLGLEAAQRAVAGTYGAFHVFKAANVCIMGGWLVLAVGAYRAKVLGLVRSVALGLAAALPLGVLKGGSDPVSLLALAGLAVALVPFGLAVLKDGPAPRWWAVGLAVAFVPVAFLLGLAG